MSKTSTTATQRATILALLQKRGSVTSIQLNDIAYRYSARIHELRHDGHQIETLLDTPSERITTYVYLARPGAARVITGKKT